MKAFPKVNAVGKPMIRAGDQKDIDSRPTIIVTKPAMPIAAPKKRAAPPPPKRDIYVILPLKVKKQVLDPRNDPRYGTFKGEPYDPEETYWQDHEEEGKEMNKKQKLEGKGPTSEEKEKKGPIDDGKPEKLQQKAKEQNEETGLEGEGELEMDGDFVEEEKGTKPSEVKETKGKKKEEKEWTVPKVTKEAKFHLELLGA